jgi:serine kinase of HPr protein (carbohydrate metabolism regulator)
LLRCFDTSSLVNDAFGMEELFHVKFPPIITAQNFNPVVELVFYVAKDSMLCLVSALVERR